MAYNLKLLKEFSLKTRVLHEIAKVFWGEFVSRLPYGINFISEETVNLIAHRQNVLNKISKIYVIHPLPEILRYQLVRAVLNLQRGYSEALVCVKMYSCWNKFTLLNHLMTGPYSAKNFIDPTGYFNELFWAKRFISDESESLYNRFELACYFCFQDVVKTLWFSMKEDGMHHPYEGTFSYIQIKFNYLVALWVYRLDSKLNDLMERNNDFAPGFYVCGFKYAKSQGNEYAARFFWDGCSDTEKATWIREMDLMDYEDLFSIAFNNHAGCINFIYSLLSSENKRSHILYHNRIQNNEYFIWTRLLLSPFYESVLNDILTIPFPVSNHTFAYLFKALALKMRELPIPEYEEIFEALWRPLSQRKRIEILEVDSNVIGNLIETASMDFLKTIIQPFPPAEKERMLLDDWQFAGISALDRFYKARDYDALFRYLLLFLMDCDPVTQKLSVRGDASEFLGRLIDGETFLKCKIVRPNCKRKEEANKVIDSLQGSLHVLNSLIEQVEEIHCCETKPNGLSFSVTENENIDRKGEGLVTKKLKHSSEDPYQEIDVKKQKPE